MSPGPTFDRVYAALKAQLTTGCLAPGHRLEPAAIGDVLNSSITPVRDALHRLAGERLVEVPRKEGFRVPVWTEAELRELYAWSLDLFELALRKARGTGLSGGPRPIANSAQPIAARTRELFLDIARRSASREHAAAVENVLDRLGSARAAEDGLVDDLADELDEVERAAASGTKADLRSALVRYHRRRRRCVPDLLVRMRARHGEGS